MRLQFPLLLAFGLLVAGGRGAERRSDALRRVSALAIVAIAAGCVAPANETPASTVDADLAERLGAFGIDGVALPVPLDLQGGLGVVASLVGHRGGEPNVGITSTGTMFTTANHNTLRSTDGGATWEVVFNLSEALPQYTCDPLPSPPVVGCPRYTRSADPMIWVDPVTDRVFTNHMTSTLCANMIISDDEGETWTMKPMTCGYLMNDHQKVATALQNGPNAPPNPGAVYPHPVYYCYQKALIAFGPGTTVCAVSLNGGYHFEYETVVAQNGVHACGGVNGHPAAHPDGTMFVPITRSCDGPVVGVSEDNGLTWAVRSGPTDVGSEEIDAEITVTPDGTAFMLARGSDHLQHLYRSTDKFVTWEGPWRVSPEGVTSTVFAGLTSLVDGKIGFAFLGTRDTGEAPSDAPNGTRWHLYTGVSLDAGAASPTFVVEQVTPDEDPVQIGCVWLSGGSNPCRNMLDFIDMAADPTTGRFVVAYTEGCVAASQHPGGAEHTGAVDCARNPAAVDEDSRGRHGAVAISAPWLL